ncbi:hypothetical protein I6N96_12710 [Enterococcus sp. BWM-S5]|uniref:Uncharacterized protein n=1 Tax=Enterococcus larvae TaxID=2794352 RepID=A0ABS4CKZ2_9ENTE|nr:hypothetical protein [Enterococcus larvae]MBP1047135.1 hypothetical protein [Enterococcus larvae]
MFKSEYLEELEKEVYKELKKDSDKSEKVLKEEIKYCQASKSISTFLNHSMDRQGRVSGFNFEYHVRMILDELKGNK